MLVEGWGIKLGDVIYVVKGCEHPLPCIHVVPKRVKGSKVDPFETVGFVRWSPCLLRKVEILCPQELDRTVVLDPIARLQELRRKLQDVVVEELFSECGESVGITGSLLWGGEVQPRDIDIIVYGECVRRAYARLHELREREVYKPLPVQLVESEYSVVPRGLSRKEFTRIITRCLLFGYTRGRLYSIRLVPCKNPVKCRQPIAADYAVLAGVLRLSMPTTPSQGILEVSGGSVIFHTLRLTYACIPSGVKLRVVGWLEEYNGYTRITPDAGYVRILGL